MRRVNESVRQVLAEAVPELKDPRIGLVTVTGVDTASDLRHATVLRQRPRLRPQASTCTLAGLAAAHGLLQGRALHES